MFTANGSQGFWANLLCWLINYKYLSLDERISRNGTRVPANIGPIYILYFTHLNFNRLFIFN